MGTFSKEAAIIAQNAGTTAAALIERLNVTYDSVEDLVADFESIRSAVFNGTISLAGAETVIDVFEAGERNNRGGFGGGNRNGGGAGGRYFSKGSQGGGGGNHPEDPGDIVVNFGKHRGKTISSIADEDPEWLEWAADNCSNTFIKNKIKQFQAA